MSKSPYREVFTTPSRCRLGDVGSCDCPRCSYANGYEAARQEAMGLHLGTVDFIAGTRPPRRTPTVRAMRQLAEALDNLGGSTFGAEDWASFKAEVRRRTRELAN